MPYQAKKFDKLLGLKGFSDQLLNNHFILYQGYVANANKLMEALSQLLKNEETARPEYSELKRRLGWEFNGMRLHEFYFENLSKKPGKINTRSELLKMIKDNFGNYGNWERDFKATGLMRGIGWVVVYFDRQEKQLFNIWVNEHDTAHLSGATPILVMDVFEHAFMLDYGLKKADYIEAFFKAIDWKAVSSRYEKALKANID